MSSENSKQPFDVSRTAARLTELFDSQWLDCQARASRFIERSSSRITGQMFLMLNVLELSASPDDSLQDQCNWLSSHFQVEIKKQSLDERYNTYGVAFLKSCLQQVLSKWMAGHISQSLGGSFKRIVLRDSTSWQLPACLSEFYPSKDSSKTGASIKIDYSVDYLTGHVEQIVLASGRQADSGLNTQHELDLAKDDLIIRDLGYWNIRQLIDYDKAGVYFLSRLKSDATLSRQGPDGAWQRVEVEDLLPVGGELLCHHLGLGKEYLAVRVCLERVPDYVREQREQKLRKLAKSQEWNLSELRVRLCGYNMYVTNAGSELLPDSLMRALYGVRWQIELMFKTWKSVLEIESVKPMSIFRFECMLYGRLILVLINNMLQSEFKAFPVEQDGFELSEYKAARVLKKS